MGFCVSRNCVIAITYVLIYTCNMRVRPIGSLMAYRHPLPVAPPPPCYLPVAPPPPCYPPLSPCCPPPLSLLPHPLPVAPVSDSRLPPSWPRAAGGPQAHQLCGGAGGGGEGQCPCAARAHVRRVPLPQDSLGRVAELRVRGQPLSSYGRKPRAFIHWVSQPLACQVRLYDKL